MKLMIRLCFTVMLGILAPVHAATYYVHPGHGLDSNSGTAMTQPLQTLLKASRLHLKPGDALLLAADSTHKGSLVLQGIQGSETQPIVIGSYIPRGIHQRKRALIDGGGWASAIQLTDCSHIQVKDLEVTANGGGWLPSQPKKGDMRCGVLVTTSKPGSYENITLENLWVHDVFFEEPGFKRGAGEVKTANGTQRYGWGIRFINKTLNATLQNVTVQDCVVENVAHTGIKFTTPRPGIQDLHVSRNQVFKSGGPGMQMSGVRRGHVKDNVVEYSGSPDDSRKWGRGSGLWTWSCDEVLIEHNRFMSANGPADSAGCHIDFNCNHVVVQYNFSAHNAGGFCEILGNNYNCAYRYNISVNDGHRIKGKNGAFQEGKVFWLSGYQGKSRPRKGPFNSYFYNNTIYTNEDLVAKMAVAKTAEGILVANNIFCIEGSSKAVKGDQYKPEGDGESQIKDVIFENNLYLHKSNWPKDVLIQDSQPFFGDPMFSNRGGLDLEDYIPTNHNTVLDRGRVIHNITNDTLGLLMGLKVDKDILGNPIDGLPDFGAIEYLKPN